VPKRLTPEEFEARLRGLGALGPCPACGNNEAGELQKTPIELETPTPGAVVGTYVAVCGRCGHLRFYVPAVLEAD
jgi:hypothetical protein